ncbi:MAG: dTMP kinase [Sutterellaceae bacterium]|nr:dTMP kinase [Burkholderiaceae bacterium]MCX7901933.1 dTMP kinase [Burkholderiaceae bacterium]MDW8431038.1 dTMP kinase [Sutterellaceae bacterium]
MKMRGRFITFEGIDGAGKSTHLTAAAQLLESYGHAVLVTREPGGTPVGEGVRTLLLEAPMDACTETLLLFAARAEHVRRLIVPALEMGRWVLCDRFTDATYAYQGGGRGVPEAAIAALERWVHPDLQPDLTLLFDLEPAVAATRVGGARTIDRFEAEQLEFFARVRSAYRARAQAHAERFVVIDAGANIETVRRQVLEAVRAWISQ